MALPPLRSGVSALVRGVRQYLNNDHEQSVSVRLGWAENMSQLNQSPETANRVVFQPSDQNGGAGKMGPPSMGPGPRRIEIDGDLVGTVRALADHEMLFTVYVWAAPTNVRDPDEEEQIEATLELRQWVVRALHAVGQADISLGSGSISWTRPSGRQYGKELVFTFAYRLPILDVPNEIVYPTANPIRTVPSHDGEPDTDP